MPARSAPTLHPPRPKGRPSPREGDFCCKSLQVKSDDLWSEWEEILLSLAYASGYEDPLTDGFRYQERHAGRFAQFPSTDFSDSFPRLSFDRNLRWLNLENFGDPLLHLFFEGG